MGLKRIAIIGGGPIGIEAALYGAHLGYDVQVLERGRVGENVRSWGHVRMFSSWALNYSSLGARALRETGLGLPDEGAYPTGAEYVEAYLRPLSRTGALEGRIREGVAVVAVGRDGMGKRYPMGGARRSRPFRILTESNRGEDVLEADVVIDCSGTYGHHNWMGNGNVPAVGEREARDRIAYRLEDFSGAERSRYEGRRVLLLGKGHSAATALEALAGLDGTEVVWVVRTDDAAPLPVIANDPLPERARLSEKANAFARGVEPRVTLRRSTVIEKVAARNGGFEVTLRQSDKTEALECDRVVALVGYHPDNGLYRELQVHECYASSGPMKLAAALLGESGTDCLAQTSKGPETLVNPEPDFYILGAKSYGRNSNFLIRLGLEQVREVYGLISSRPELDLYREAAS